MQPSTKLSKLWNTAEEFNFLSVLYRNGGPSVAPYSNCTSLSSTVQQELTGTQPCGVLGQLAKLGM